MLIPEFVSMKKFPDVLRFEYPSYHEEYSLVDEYDGSNFSKEYYRHNSRKLISYCMLNCYWYFIIEVPKIADAEYDWCKELIKQCVQIAELDGDDNLNFKFMTESNTLKEFKPHEECYESLIKQYYPKFIYRQFECLDI